MSLQVSMMDSVATIFRPSLVTRDDDQGVVQVFTVLRSGLTCSQQQTSSSVQDLYLQRNVFVGTTLYFVEDPGATVNDLISVTDEATQTNQLYLVQGNARSDTKGNLWLVDCQQQLTPDGPPTVVEPTASAISSTAATLTATTSGDGSSDLTGQGFVVSITSVNSWPTIGGTGVTQLTVAIPAVGAFSKTATGLTPGTRYSFAPYSINGVATTYGTVTEFVTS